MIQDLLFGVSLLVSDFLPEVSKPTKTSKQDHSFYNTVSTKKPRSFYEPQLTQRCKKETHETQPITLLTLQILHQICFV